jgi:hypothetical protein
VTPPTQKSEGLELCIYKLTVDRRKMETPIRDLKLKLAKELPDPEITYRMMQLTASIAMEIATIAKIRADKFLLIPVGNSKAINVQASEARVFEQMTAGIDGKSNAEQRAAKMALMLIADEQYQENLCSSVATVHDLDMHEAVLKGYKMEWQVIQENMMNQRAAAALLEGITDVEVKVKKEKKPKKESMPESLLTPEQ